jgi:hypothetical protein
VSQDGSEVRTEDPQVSPEASAPVQALAADGGPGAKDSSPLQVALVNAVTPVGGYVTADHQYFFNGIGPKPSVTTILRIIDKPALTGYLMAQVARAAVDNPLAFQTVLLEQGDKAAVNYLVQKAREPAARASAIGTGVHTIADMALRASVAASEAFQIPEAWIPYAEAFSAFTDDYSARTAVVSSEKAVMNLTEGYGGTYDMLIQISGELWLLDVKASVGLYPEYALQLSAYQHAEFIMLPGDPQRYAMPSVQRTGLLWLKADGSYQLVEYPVTDRDYMAFLAAKELWEWRKEGRHKVHRQ